MRMLTLVPLFCAFIYLIFESAASSRGYDNEKMKDRVKEHLEDYNPCSTENKQAPIHCFCNPDNRPGNARRIECWIFGNDLTEDYFIWTYFSTHPKIFEMTIKVVKTGVFSFIPTIALTHLKLLRTFTVSYGTIAKIEPYAFANLTQLRNINLIGCQIVILQRYSFAYLLNLTEMNLSENHITELNKDVFFHLPNLRRFYISQNNLRLIHEGTFRQLTRLLELDLSTNYINALTNYTFTGLSELKKLDLSNNLIKILGDLAFAELWVLEDLRLDSNQITFISERAFAGLNYLEHLNLRNNQLTILPNNLLDSVPAIYYLDLYSNKLETVTSAIVKPIIHNLYNVMGYFNIANNKLVCDCRLEWLYKLKNESKNEETRNMLEDLICYSKKDVAVELVSERPNEYDGYNDYNVRHDDSPKQLQTEYQRRFFDISPDQLSCPKKQEATKPQFNTPEYAEINSGSGDVHLGMSNCLILIVYWIGL